MDTFARVLLHQGLFVIRSALLAEEIPQGSTDGGHELLNARLFVRLFDPLYLALDLCYLALHSKNVFYDTQKEKERRRLPTIAETP